MCQTSVGDQFFLHTVQKNDEIVLSTRLRIEIFYKITIRWNHSNFYQTKLKSAITDEYEN